MLPLYAGSLVIASLHSEMNTSRVRVAFESDNILVFDDDDRADGLDSRICYNAVARRNISKRIRDIEKLGRVPNLYVNVVRDFFKTKSFAFNMSGHYVYKGNPVSDFCERSDLIVIKSVR